jgi:hypothetical protein
LQGFSFVSPPLLLCCSELVGLHRFSSTSIPLSTAHLHPSVKDHTGTQWSSDDHPTESVPVCLCPVFSCAIISFSEGQLRCNWRCVFSVLWHCSDIDRPGDWVITPDACYDFLVVHPFPCAN